MQFGTTECQVYEVHWHFCLIQCITGAVSVDSLLRLMATVWHSNSAWWTACCVSQIISRTLFKDVCLEPNKCWTCHSITSIWWTEGEKYMKANIHTHTHTHRRDLMHNMWPKSDLLAEKLHTFMRLWIICEKHFSVWIICEWYLFIYLYFVWLYTQVTETQRSSSLVSAPLY